MTSQPHASGSTSTSTFTSTSRPPTKPARTTRTSHPPALERMPTRLERQASRLSNALTHVRSIEYPPDPDQLVVEDEESSASTSNVGDEEKNVGLSNSDINTDKKSKNPEESHPVLDIEHAPVQDDPRLWSEKKKWAVLLITTFAVLIPILASSIYNPVINEIQSDLNGTSTEIGLSLSLYILHQGYTPTLWAMISEFRGRKTVYIVSYALYTGALIGASRSQSMSVFIVMRVLQATGGGAVMAGGAGTLADMYESHERGKRMGIFYGIPMLGPSIGPLLGGVLGKAFGWRSVFYFLAACAGLLNVVFIFLPDSWRRERSRSYQRAYAQAVKRAKERDTKRALVNSEGSKATTSVNEPHLAALDTDVQLQTDPHTTGEKGDPDGRVKVKSRRWYTFGFDRASRRGGNGVVVDSQETEEFKIGIRDINPFSPMAGVLKRPTNLSILIASAIIFASQYTLVYTASITLGNAPYNYNTLQIGLVLLSFGSGNVVATVFGGRYSDKILRRLKKRNGGVAVSEMRLKSTFIAIPTAIASFLAYAWLAQEKVHIAAIVVVLFIAGFSLLWIYPSTLAYLVDVNPGASATAVSCNSLFRGSLACIMSQIATIIQDGIGDGGLYTIFAGLLAISTGLIVLLSYKGEGWREREAHKKEKAPKS